MSAARSCRFFGGEIVAKAHLTAVILLPCAKGEFDLTGIEIKAMKAINQELSTLEAEPLFNCMFDDQLPLIEKDARLLLAGINSLDPDFDFFFYLNYQSFFDRDPSFLTTMIHSDSEETVGIDGYQKDLDLLFLNASAVIKLRRAINSHLSENALIDISVDDTPTSDSLAANKGATLANIVLASIQNNDFSIVPVPPDDFINLGSDEISSDPALCRYKLTLHITEQRRSRSEQLVPAVMRWPDSMAIEFTYEQPSNICRAVPINFPSIRFALQSVVDSSHGTMNDGSNVDTNSSAFMDIGSYLRERIAAVSKSCEALAGDVWLFSRGDYLEVNSDSLRRRALTWNKGLSVSTNCTMLSRYLAVSIGDNVKIIQPTNLPHKKAEVICRLPPVSDAEDKADSSTALSTINFQLLWTRLLRRTFSTAYVLRFAAGDAARGTDIRTENPFLRISDSISWKLLKQALDYFRPDTLEKRTQRGDPPCIYTIALALETNSIFNCANDVERGRSIEGAQFDKEEVSVLVNRMLLKEGLLPLHFEWNRSASVSSFVVESVDPTCRIDIHRLRRVKSLISSRTYKILRKAASSTAGTMNDDNTVAEQGTPHNDGVNARVPPFVPNEKLGTATPGTRILQKGSEFAVLEDVLRPDVFDVLSGRLKLIKQKAVGAESFFIPFVQAAASAAADGEHANHTNTVKHPPQPRHSEEHHRHHGSRSFRPRSVVEHIILKHIAPKVVGPLVCTYTPTIKCIATTLFTRCQFLFYRFLLLNLSYRVCILASEPSSGKWLSRC
jgi:hypothetical protein